MITWYITHFTSLHSLSLSLSPLAKRDENIFFFFTVESLMSILISSPSLKLLRSPSSRESPIGAAFLGNRLKASRPLSLRLRMDAVSSTSVSSISVGEDFPLDYEQWLPLTDPDSRRRAGVLLHPTSFRSPHGIGDLGEDAFRFIDWLHSTGCSLWQVI